MFRLLSTMELVLVLSVISQRTVAIDFNGTSNGPLNNSTRDTISSEQVKRRVSVSEKHNTWADFAAKFMPVNLYVDRYVTFVYFIVGFPGNLISFFVWSNRKMYNGNSAAVYLTFMSANNIVVLLFALHRDLTRAWSLQLRTTPFFCETKFVLVPASQYASPMFVLGFTTERWLAIYKPFAIDRICSIRRAIYVCVAIIIIIIALCSGNAYLTRTKEFTCDSKATDSPISIAYLSGLEVIFSGFVPLSALTLNCLVIRELARVNKANKRLSEIPTQASNHGTNDSAVNTGIQHQGNNGQQECTTGKKGKLRLSSMGYSVPLTRRQTTPSSDLLTTRSTDANNNAENLRHSVTSKSDQIPIPRQRPRTSGKSSYVKGRPQTDPLETVRCTREKSTNQQNHRFRATTVMLLVVSFYMIIVALLGGVMYIITNLYSIDQHESVESLMTNPRFQKYRISMYFKAFGDEIALSYYAFSFFIFYTTGPSFRQHVHRLLRGLINRSRCYCNNSWKSAAADTKDTGKKGTRIHSHRSHMKQKLLPLSDDTVNGESHRPAQVPSLINSKQSGRQDITVTDSLHREQLSDLAPPSNVQLTCIEEQKPSMIHNLDTQLNINNSKDLQRMRHTDSEIDLVT